MFTTVHKSTRERNIAEYEAMKRAVFYHLYKMNIEILVAKQMVITDTWLAICRQTAKDDIFLMERQGNLRSYFNRIKKEAV